MHTTAVKLLRRLGVIGAVVLVGMMVPLPHVTFIEEAVGATVALPPVDPATPEEMAEVQAAADEPLDTERVQATEEDVEEFSLMAVVFDTPPDEPVVVRVQDDAGSWGEWRELHVALDEGPDDPTNFGTEPFWVGTSEAYEVNLDTADASGARVVLVRNELRRMVAVSEPVAEAAVPPPFGINPRSTWGARAVGSMSYGDSVKKAVVHHTVSGNSYSQSQVPGVIAGIQAYHIDGRGWSDIGYNFVVDKYGGLWEGRAGGMDRPVIGAHASGFNTNTVGISVIGDYRSVSPSAASKEAVARVAGWKLFLGGQNPVGNSTFTSGGGPRYPRGTVVNLPNVVGHTDVGSTECPGRIHAALGEIRQRAQEWTDWMGASSSPVGNLESVPSSGGTVTATGWAGDRSSGQPPTVRLAVGGVTASAATSINRPDVVAAYPELPLASGFALTATGVPPGLQDACVSVADTDGGVDLDFPCRRVRVADPTGLSPDGRITGTAVVTGGFRIGGWTADADGAAPRSVTVTVNGSSVGAYPTASNGLFNITVRGVIAGRRDVCIVVRNGGAGRSARADCTQLNVPGGSPLGNFEGFTHSGNDVTMSGWAFDPEQQGSIPVRIVLDGTRRWTAYLGGRRDDVAAVHGMGAASGWAFGLGGVPAGDHVVCAEAVNVGGGADTSLGCRNFTVK